MYTPAHDQYLSHQKLVYIWVHLTSEFIWITANLCSSFREDRIKRHWNIRNLDEKVGNGGIAHSIVQTRSFSSRAWALSMWTCSAMVSALTRIPTVLGNLAFEHEFQGWLCQGWLCRHLLWTYHRVPKVNRPEFHMICDVFLKIKSFRFNLHSFITFIQ